MEATSGISPEPALLPRPTTVREAVIALLRDLGCDRLFGNPGSTELPLFRDWPADIRYVLGLHESVAVAMADGYAQATRRTAFVNLHSASGVGHALGSVFTAFKNRAPVVVIAGQQARSLLPADAYLAATEAAQFPKPYIKWSIEPARAEDVPAAIARACYTSMQEPMGPTFVSVPADDWDRIAAPVRLRRVVSRRRPDRDAIAALGAALDESERPAIVMGSDVDIAGAFAAAVALAERYQAHVWGAPRAWRCVFPETHPLFMGFLPPLRDQLVAKLAPYDLALVIGAPAFTYHKETDCPPWPGHLDLFQIVNDPVEAAQAPQGVALLASVDAALEDLLARPATRPRAAAARRPPRGAAIAATPIPPAYLMSRIASLRPAGSIIVEEAPTSRAAMNAHLPIDEPDGFFTAGSGGLGYGLPAAVGIAMGKPGRRVIAVIGDGSCMYAVQGLWTAAQWKLPMAIVIVNNASYFALKHMARMFDIKETVGADLPGIDVCGLARAFGCEARRVKAPQELDDALRHAFGAGHPVVVDVAVAAMT
jgi:benzoylformate decarboxylase